MSDDPRRRTRQIPASTVYRAGEKGDALLLQKRRSGAKVQRDTTGTRTGEKTPRTELF